MWPQDGHMERPERPLPVFRLNTKTFKKLPTIAPKTKRNKSSVAVIIIIL